jgi:uncharacterized protein involved in tellurium resistance
MKNITMDRQGDVLTIKVNLKERYGKSASGKTTIIGSTEGAVGLDDGTQVSLNVYIKE